MTGLKAALGSRANEGVTVKIGLTIGLRWPDFGRTGCVTSAIDAHG